MPPNINLSSDRFAMFNKKRDISRTFGAWMQVGDERFESEEIHRLYESDDYPLRRRAD